MVMGKNGEVYSGVKVALKFAASGAAAATTVSADDGEFRFNNVRPGNFQLIFTSQGFVTQVVRGTLQSGQAYDAHAVILTVAATVSDVRVTASTEEIAEAQLNVEEKQRVLGVIPNFYVSYDQDAAPLTTRQKYQLAWRSSIDPVTWAATGIFAGVEQADNTFSGYGQGAQGYAKRFGAGYADTFIGTMLGGAVLPAIFKQDPRYFVKGTGTVRSRVWYAVYNSWMCKGDNGRWEVNYSALLGGMAAAGISNAYYPAANRDGAALTFENAGVGVAFGAVENLMQEFVVRKLTPGAHKHDISQP